MFQAILERLGNALTDTIALAVERGFVRDLRNALGPLAVVEEPPAIGRQDTIEAEPANGKKTKRS